MLKTKLFIYLFTKKLHLHTNTKTMGGMYCILKEKKNCLTCACISLWYTRMQRPPFTFHNMCCTVAHFPTCVPKFAIWVASFHAIFVVICLHSMCNWGPIVHASGACFNIGKEKNLQIYNFAAGFFFNLLLDILNLWICRYFFLIYGEIGVWWSCGTLIQLSHLCNCFRFSLLFLLR